MVLKETGVEGMGRTDEAAVECVVLSGLCDELNAPGLDLRALLVSWTGTEGCLVC